MNKILDLIPETSESEAFNAIQSIVLLRHNKAEINCHFANKFKIYAVITGNLFAINSGNFNFSGTKDEFLNCLEKAIYTIDESISEGHYLPEKTESKQQEHRPPAPTWMDIPVWNQKHKRWYDAEY